MEGIVEKTLFLVVFVNFQKASREFLMSLSLFNTSENIEIGPVKGRVYL